MKILSGNIHGNKAIIFDRDRALSTLLYTRRFIFGFADTHSNTHGWPWINLPDHRVQQWHPPPQQTKAVGKGNISVLLRRGSSRSRSRSSLVIFLFLFTKSWPTTCQAGRQEMWGLQSSVPGTRESWLVAFVDNTIHYGFFLVSSWSSLSWVVTEIGKLWVLICSSFDIVVDNIMMVIIYWRWHGTLFQEIIAHAHTHTKS